MKSFALSALLALAVISTAAAQTPFTYQGQLMQNGQPFNGTVNIVFDMFDSPAGPGSIGDETHNNVPVSNGHFTVDIGGNAGWDLNLGNDLWLEITVDGNTLAPRQKLSPTPHALIADSFKLPFDSSDFLFSGLTVPTLKIRNDGTGGAIAGLTDNANAHAITGSNSATAAVGSGVLGVANSPTGYGVEGINNATTGSAVGGFFQTTSKTGFAAWARVTGGGVHNGSFAGVFENNAGSGFATGVQGSSSSATNGFGVRGWHSASNGFGAGVYGLSSSANGYGGYFEANAPGGVPLFVNGMAQVKVLQILGGSDLSEGFDVSGEIEPGMVVAIDPHNPGNLVASAQAYDKKVAGIVSGANGVNVGLIMGQKDSVADGKHPIALSGRVYCRAIGGTTGIEPGDLLTTAATPGHAMKASDPAAAPGATIGKAMSALKPGETGLVLVLVNLQ